MKRFDYYLFKKSQETLLKVLNHALYSDDFGLSSGEYSRMLNLRVYLLNNLQDET